MRLRKHLFDLKPEDFERYPVWAYVGDASGLHGYEYEDGEDEEEIDDDLMMTPYPVPYDPAHPLPLEIVCLVAAEMTLADGDIFPGRLYASGIGMAEIQHAQPYLFTAQGQVNFYLADTSNLEQIAEKYRLMGKSAEQVFPLHYRSKIQFVGEVGGRYEGMSEGFEGIIEGFYSWDRSDGKTIKFLR